MAGPSAVDGSDLEALIDELRDDPQAGDQRPLEVYEGHLVDRVAEPGVDHDLIGIVAGKLFDDLVGRHSDHPHRFDVVLAGIGEGLRVHVPFAGASQVGSNEGRLGGVELDLIDECRVGVRGAEKLRERVAARVGGLDLLLGESSAGLCEGDHERGVGDDQKDHVFVLPDGLCVQLHTSVLA